jgi:CDP-4-dehydro-6-deoxyglucose reductase, E3
MTFQITVQPSGSVFECAEDETLLMAGLRQGLTIPHACKDGVCGACKGKVLDGQFEHGAKAVSLTATDKEAGMALYCCATPKSNMEIECRQLARSGDFPIKTLPSRVERLEKKAPDVIEILLRLPAAEQFRFRPGQYIDFLLKDGKRRSYSLANAPREDNMLELHIRKVEGGLFTTQVFETLKVKDILRFDGPHGGFFLREESDKPIILLASGTGFAPIKAIVEGCLSKSEEGFARPITVYWGCRKPEDLYMNELPVQWASEHGCIRYVPVMSDAGPSDGWQGRTGFVHQAVMVDFPDLSGHEVYACGAPVMIDAARKDFVDQCNLPEEAFFADAFTFAVNS